MPDSTYADVLKRVKRLNPAVKGFSQYIQRLVSLDLKYHLIDDDGGINESVVSREKGQTRPFEEPLAPLENNALTAA